MRFGQNRTNDPLRNRKSHMRLFVQVMLLGFMLIAVQWAAQARHWTWLVPEQKSPETPEIALKQLDFKVKPRNSTPLVAGEVKIAAEPGTPVPPVDQSESDQQLAPESLSMMDDGRLGTLRAEQVAIDHLLSRLRTTDPTQLTRLARTDIGFVELNDRPAEHRGQLLAYTGTLWRLTQERGIETPAPGDDVYEAWIMTPDAANNPTRFLMTEIPSGVTVGNQLDRQVAFTGYFVKRYGYATERGTHIAPLLVGRTLSLRTPVAPARMARPQQSWVQWLAGLVVAGVGTVFLLKRLSREMKPPQRRELPERIPRVEVQPVDALATDAPSDVPAGDENPAESP